MIYDKKLKECEENIEVLIEKGQYLFYQLDKTLQTLKLINQDLAADRQAEDAYQSAREVEKFAREAEKFKQAHMNDTHKWQLHKKEDKATEYMDRREIERTKYGKINPDYEQSKADAYENEQMTKSLSDNMDYDDCKRDVETVADDILRAAGWTKEDLQKGA
jgi:hypothetical protein